MHSPAAGPFRRPSAGQPDPATGEDRQTSSRPGENISSLEVEERVPAFPPCLRCGSPAQPDPVQVRCPVRSSGPSPAASDAEIIEHCRANSPTTGTSNGRLRPLPKPLHEGKIQKYLCVSGRLRADQ
jgi:hypothetical protein